MSFTCTIPDNPKQMNIKKAQYQNTTYLKQSTNMCCLGASCRPTDPAAELESRYD
jgi:hypothetical protein